MQKPTSTRHRLLMTCLVAGLALSGPGFAAKMTPRRAADLWGFSSRVISSLEVVMGVIYDTAVSFPG